MSKVHVNAACTSCILVLLHAACLCNMFVPHTHAVFPCCMPTSMLHVFERTPTCPC
jgi:hypothetical protein